MLLTDSNAYQEHNGRLSFMTDAWTSPNHRAFVAFVVHLACEGVPIAFPLDIVEVPKVSVSNRSDATPT